MDSMGCVGDDVDLDGLTYRFIVVGDPDMATRFAITPCLFDGASVPVTCILARLWFVEKSINFIFPSYIDLEDILLNLYNPS